MKVNSVNNFMFKGKIIDSHGHIGSWNEGNALKNYNNDIDVFIKSNLENGDIVEKMIISNLDCMSKKSVSEFISNEVIGNRNLLEFAKNNPKIAPLATCQPGFGNVENIAKLFAENPNKFVGLKFHPEQLQIPVDNIAYEPYLKFAQENSLTCLFHSGSSAVSNPELIQKMAKKFPETNFVIAHWGAEWGGDYDKVTNIIIDSVKNKNSKIYADISWVDCNDKAKSTLKKIIKQLKEADAMDRILFGSDAPLGRFGGNGENGLSPRRAYSELVSDIKAMINNEFEPKEAEEIIDKIFYKNSTELFFKKGESVKTPVEMPKPKGKIGKYLVVFGAVVITGIAALKIASNKKKGDDKNFSKVA